MTSTEDAFQVALEVFKVITTNLPEVTYDENGNLVKKGLKYLVIGSSQYRAAATKAAELWKADRDYFIRVVIQTEVLTGYSYSDTYWKRLKR